MGVDDVDVVRKGYAAFSAGDLDSLRELFTEDATWSVPGASPYSGTKRGRDAILAYFVDVVTASEGTFQTVQVAVSGGDGYVFSLDRTKCHPQRRFGRHDRCKRFPAQRGTSGIGPAILRGHRRE